MALLFRKLPAWIGLFLVFMGSPLLRALDEPSSFVLDLPFQANQATPVWLGHPVISPTTFATLDLPVIPPDSTSSLLVTVFFTEKTGGFLRITWQGEQGDQVLCNNFYEGIGMTNQRSLLIAPETLAGQGTLVFQCGEEAIGIQRIKLEWLENKNGLVSPQIQDLLVTPATGLTQPAQNLDGQLSAVEPAAWKGKIVNVPITDSPARIEMGVEFNVQMDSLPATARLVLKEAGLPWGKTLVVWINQQRAGTITPAVPDLTDEGYLADATAVYVGWRNGSFYLPVSLLKTGTNAVQFSVEDEGAAASTTTADSSPAPLAVKDVILQLDYPAPAPSPDNSSTSAPSSAVSSPATDTIAPLVSDPGSASSNALPVSAPTSTDTNAAPVTAPAPTENIVP